MIELIEALPSVPAGPFVHRGEELERWFRMLGQADDAGRQDAEEAIWSIWCDHPEGTARTTMVAGIRQLSDGVIDTARGTFDTLVESFPSWAETWNKRATIHFLAGDDAASVADIARTLTLEPRHFGALGGLVQISLRNGDPDAALAALEQLRRVNPSAPGVMPLIADLRARGQRTVH